MGIENGPGSEFLKDRYWNKEEFREAVEESTGKAKRLSEDLEIPQKPHEQIPYYLERVEKVSTREDPKTGERGRLFLEKSIYPRFIIKRENISDGYIKGILLGNFAERLGYEPNDLQNEELKSQILKQFAESTGQEFSRYQIPEDEREKVKTMVENDQKARLDEWFDYLTSPEAQNVPAAFRYWAFAEMLKLGSYDEERKVFNKRTDTTAASFPELNQQALALVFDEVQRRRTGEPSSLVAQDEASQVKFRDILQSENFGKLYAFVLEHVNSLRLPEERLAVTSGAWRQFPQGTSAKELTQTLQGFNTKWCIAGEGYAENYLSHSDLWVYYSKDKDGSNSIPRACIVDSKEQGITEVRGIMSSKEAKQHLDSFITPVVAEKLKSLPGGEKWQSAMEDIKHLAKIHFKHLQNNPLDKEDLIFLYEIDHPIQSLGYQRDPRIEAIRKFRNPKEDAPIVFGCEPGEIAWGENEIGPSTKAYVGSLFKGIFDRLSHLEHIYTAFPEAPIRRSQLEIGGKTTKELEIDLEQKGFRIYEYARDMLQSKDFTTQKNPETIDLVRLKVRNLGFTDFATTDQLYARAQELGLELCPAEVGPHQRLKDTDQPMGDYYRIAMKQLSDRSGDPSVFCLGHDDRGLWLRSSIAPSTYEWNLSNEFVFRLRKVS